jgi:hypothetical protein
MNRQRMTWIVGIVALSLLVAGVAVLAANGFGRKAGTGTQTASCQVNLDADGDGTPNGQDPDWVPTCDGPMSGAAQGEGAARMTSCPARQSGSASCPNAEAGVASGQGCGRMSMRNGTRSCGGGRG